MDKEYYYEYLAVQEIMVETTEDFKSKLETCSVNIKNFVEKFKNNLKNSGHDINDFLKIVEKQMASLDEYDINIKSGEEQYIKNIRNSFLDNNNEENFNEGREEFAKSINQLRFDKEIFDEYLEKCENKEEIETCKVLTILLALIKNEIKNYYSDYEIMVNCNYTDDDYDIKNKKINDLIVIDYILRFSNNLNSPQYRFLTHKILEK